MDWAPILLVVAGLLSGWLWYQLDKAVADRDHLGCSLIQLSKYVLDGDIESAKRYAADAVQQEFDK